MIVMGADPIDLPDDDDIAPITGRFRLVRVDIRDDDTDDLSDEIMDRLADIRAKALEKYRETYGVVA
jgi:hypothetical protein